jgi:hypothetical protein
MNVTQIKLDGAIGYLLLTNAGKGKTVRVEVHKGIMIKGRYCFYTSLPPDRTVTVRPKTANLKLWEISQELELAIDPASKTRGCRVKEQLRILRRD